MWGGVNTLFTIGYDDIKVSHPSKQKLISLITSNKCFTRGHRERLEFALKLKEYYGEKLDLFGSGFNSFDDKWDVLAPYKYHICIENSSYPHYWSEKLADVYLAECFPLYYGAPNLNEYFNPQSFAEIDVHDIDKSIRIIDDAINNNLYESRKEKIREAKRLVLDEYNLFAMLARVMDTMNPDAPKRLITIRHDKEFFDLQKVNVLLLDRIRNRMLTMFRRPPK